MSSDADKPHYLGHRARVRERVLLGRTDTLADYEVLELLLFYLFPRKDTKLLAKKLIDSFGSLPKVLHGTPEKLREIEGVGEQAVVFFKSLKEAAIRMSREDVMHHNVLDSWEKVIAYCRIQNGYEETEHFRILFLNHKNVLIADEVQQKGTIDHASVYPREVIRRTLGLGATGMILVHNHPSGDPTPSAADVEVTERLADAGRPLGIQVFDHIIITPSSYTSLKTLGLI